MSIFKKKKKNRVCVIGLDGVPFSLLQDLARKNVMPAAARLIEAGRLHRMKASLPEISAVSWTDFMTGVNAGTHGIFGFTDFKPGSYEIRFPNFLDLQAKTFWDILGEKNKKSIVINQPSTYPARTINGVLISGFVAVEMAKAVFPRTYLAALEQIGYQIDVDSAKIRENPACLWPELQKSLSGRRKALNFFWDEDWDYFEFVVTETDRLHHFLWNAGPNADHPQHQNFLNYYREIDGLIDKISVSFSQMTGGLDGLYILSDHGFTGILQEVYLNAWLEKEGYLHFLSAAPGGLEDIGPATTAFALDPNRIYVNLKNKFPKGTVDISEIEPLKEEIARKLEKLEYAGKKVVRKVFRTDDVYSGPLMSKGPDLIVLGENGFDMKGSIKKKEIFGVSTLQGMHTWDDALFWANADHGPDLSIANIAAIILAHFA